FFLDEARAVTIDASNNVYVTGNSSGKYATIAYSGAGVPLWTNRYGIENTDSGAEAIAVDCCNVYVTGDYATVAYLHSGVALWTNRYDTMDESFNQIKALAPDGRGNVYVTGGSTPNGSSAYLDWITIKYISRPGLTISSKQPETAFHLSLSGRCDTTYRIETSSNLVNWVTLTNFANSNVSMEFKDFDATNLIRFYRAASP
ncbi:MAG: hypothetical protein ABIQ35_13205, partial [Verrucomicrobiota bacterium]